MESIDVGEGQAYPVGSGLREYQSMPHGSAARSRGTEGQMERLNSKGRDGECPEPPRRL